MLILKHVPRARTKWLPMRTECNLNSMVTLQNFKNVKNALAKAIVPIKLQIFALDVQVHGAKNTIRWSAMNAL